TSPVGTTEMLVDWSRPLCKELHLSLGEDSDVDFAYCPERVLPGKIMQELVQNDRIVGGLTQRATRKAAEIYKQLTQGHVFETNPRTAEMTKLAENSFRDVSVAFVNELSRVCELLSISVWEVIELANRHPRVKLLKPGPGVGGHCVAVDPWFIVS